MKYRKLGNTSLRVSEISFGCMSLDPSQDNDQIISMAIDGGINLFDTADIYNEGENEKILGKAVKTRRKDLVIATKVGNRLKADKSGLEWVPGKEYILTHVEESLRRLDTDYIDLYQLHGGTLDDPFDDILEAFELLCKQGKIRYYGISSIRPNVIRQYAEKSDISSVMMQYSLLDRRPEESCLPLLRNEGIGLLVRGSLAKGLLAGKPATEYLKYGKLEVHKIAMAIKSISSETRNPVQTSVNYVLQEPAVSTVVVGMRTESQVKDAIKISDTLPLTAHEYEYLNNVLHPDFYEEHR